MRAIFPNGLPNTFDRYGFYFPFEALNEQEVIHLNLKIDAAISSLAGELNALKRGKLNEKYGFIDEISRKKEILDVVEAAIGPNILCWAAGVFSKPPYSKLFTSWHQDYFYWGLFPSDVVTVWIALTDVTVGNGCMEFIKDEKYFIELEHIETFDKNSMLSHGQHFPSLPEDVSVTQCILKPGQASLHHINTLHSSGPNSTSYERRGLVIRYVAAHVNQTKFEKDTAVLVRGNQQSSNIIIVPGGSRFKS